MAKLFQQTPIANAPPVIVGVFGTPWTLLVPHDHQGSTREDPHLPQGLQSDDMAGILYIYRLIYVYFSNIH